jgi:hypothetical protein
VTATVITRRGLQKAFATSLATMALLRNIKCIFTAYPSMKLMKRLVCELCHNLKPSESKVDGFARA